MEFHRYEPSPELKRVVECFWSVVDDDRQPIEQKIIPDGFLELIFHFGDPFQIRLKSRWSLQHRNLFAGQISRYFFLKNTGRSGVFGVKLQPSSISHLFGISMNRFTDAVVPLSKAMGKQVRALMVDISNANSDRERIGVLQTFFSQQKAIPLDHPVDEAIRMIFSSKGMVTVAGIAATLQVSERYLEQLFKKYVGLSPKFYARIIRFSHLFKLIKDNDPDWADLVFQSGYYDQSHFIRNFKAFTGEDPSRYPFFEKSMANFFLKTPR